jgi:hypothetical protein
MLLVYKYYVKYHLDALRVLTLFRL